MRPLAASIVILSSAIVFAAGAWVNHSDTQTFVMGVAGALFLIGFGLLGASWKDKG